MGQSFINTANGGAGHLEPESFAICAEPEISSLPFWVAGECFSPNCCARFTPSRSWSRYCCDTCAEQDRREMRKWGHKAALALLVHRMHAYPKTAPERVLCNAARRYVRQVQSTWLRSRQARCALARKARAI
ncbi:hypothetical protein JI58_08290 [Marinosulfonomonas sp. PRT-SC04]|nr:hypothetical protein JI58_08290 [Marinosulfonomonas sp. PRT-SC04]